ncbi:MAG: sterol desaturase, partial [Sphingobacteriia bacterium]
DKLFGTFVEEEETPVYGLTSPLKSHSFLWQHFHFLLEMIVAVKYAKGLNAKLRMIFGKPDDIDPRIRLLLERKLLSRKEPLKDHSVLQNFIGIQTLITLVTLFVIILFEKYLHSIQLYIAAIFIITSVISTGAMMEQKQWVFYLDFARLGLLSIFIYLFYPSFYLLVTILIILFASILFYKSLQNRYVHLIYRYT